MVDVQLILLYSQTFTQLNEHCDWLILGHVPLIKFKCIPTGIQLRSCCPHAVLIVSLLIVSLFLLKESLNIYNKTLHVWSHKKLVSFVFPRVLMFPLTSSRETSGLSGKQNQLFPSGPYIKCIIFRPTEWCET